MKAVLRAHYDGRQIQLDEPFELEPSTPLTVIVGGAEDDSERRDWLSLSKHGLTAAYDDEDEPEYSVDMIKEPNPDYEGG